MQVLRDTTRMPADACMLLMRFLTKSLDLEVDKSRPAKPGFHLAFEAYIETLEIVGTLAILGLTGTAFLPQFYVDLQVSLDLEAMTDLCRHVYFSMNMHKVMDI